MTLYHGLAIYTEVTFVNVTLVEAVPSVLKRKALPDAAVISCSANVR